MHTVLFTTLSLTVTCVVWLLTPSFSGFDR